VLRVIKVPLVLPDGLVPLEPLDQLDIKVFLAPLVLLAHVDLLVLQVALSVPQVSQVLSEFLVQLVDPLVLAAEMVLLGQQVVPRAHKVPLVKEV
jgi:hypothetical protein